MFAPLIFRGGDTFQRLLIRVVEVVGQLLLRIIALFEFGLGYGGHLTEVAIAVEDLVDLIFDFGFKVEIFQQFGDGFLDFMGCGVATDLFGVFAVGLDELILQRLLDLPEGVAIADVLEDQLTFFR